MKRRYLYVLLFGVPALLVSSIITLFAFGAAAGFLWIFVFGDSPWPPLAETILMIVFFGSFFTLLAGFVSAAFIVGKNQEKYASLNVKHSIAAVGVTVLASLIVALHQWVDHIESSSDSSLCARFCLQKGFNASGMPRPDAKTPICSCFDAEGREAVKVPMGEITPGRGK